MTSTIEFGDWDYQYVDGDFHTMNSYGYTWSAIGNTIYYESTQVDTFTPTPTNDNLATGAYKQVVFDIASEYMSLPYNVVNNMKT